MFNCLCGLSLALALGVAGLWVRSKSGSFVDLVAWYSEVDSDGWQSGATVISRPGYLAAWGGRGQDDYKSTPGWTLLVHHDQAWHNADEDTERPAFFGISHRYTEGSMPGNGFGAPSRPYTERYIAISSPLLITLFLAAPTCWWISQRRRRELARDGRCTACGYDLRGTPDRCPECGTQRNQAKRRPADVAAA